MKVKPWVIRSSLLTSRWHSGGSAIVWAKDETSAKQVLAAEILKSNVECDSDEAEFLREPVAGNPQEWVDAIYEIEPMEIGATYIFQDAGCC
jgi:hypothetical protein